MTKVGFYFDLRNPPDRRRPWSHVYGAAIELCEEAERLGADSLWFSEHHLFDDGYLPQPLTFAAAVAARTRRVRIGTAIVIAPLHHPLELAENAAIVDILSDGRLELGLGAGYRVPEFDAFGADHRRRHATTDECVERLREYWTDGRLQPQPVQSPLPIWLGYGTAPGARRAGRLGTGLLSADPSLVAPYLEGLAAAGHPASAARMAGMVSVFVTDDPERSWPMIAPNHGYQWNSYRRHAAEGSAGDPPTPLDLDRARRNGLAPGFGNILVATPTDAAAAIAAHLSGTPVETVLIWASPGALPDDVAMDHLRLVCTELAPRLALATASGEATS